MGLMNFLRDHGAKRAGGGAFSDFLQRLPANPRALWYPSAGQEFRDLVYLHPSSLCPPAASIAPPDVYIHTDDHPWRRSDFLDAIRLHQDERTHVEVLAFEELEAPADFPLDERLTDLRPSSATGRAVYLNLRMTSDVLGEFTRDVLYYFVDNAAFLSKTILPYRIAVTHLLNIRCGGGGGGGESDGRWIQELLGVLRTEVLISDAAGRSRPSGSERAWEVFPDLASARTFSPPILLTKVWEQRPADWMNDGRIEWFQVSSPASAPARERVRSLGSPARCVWDELCHRYPEVLQELAATNTVVVEFASSPAGRAEADVLESARRASALAEWALRDVPTEARVLFFAVTRPTAATILAKWGLSLQVGELAGAMACYEGGVDFHGVDGTVIRSEDWETARAYALHLLRSRHQMSST